MGEKSGRIKTVAVSLALLVVIGVAAAFIATEYGTSRAITVLVAIALIAALAWLILTIVSIVAATSARRDVDEGPLRNEQRPIPKRAPILPDEKRERSTGHRRRDPDA